MSFQNQPVPSPLPTHAQTDRNAPTLQINGTIFPTLSRTNATYTSDPLYNAHAKGVRLYNLIGDDGASGTVTVEIQVKDPVTDTWVRIAGAVTAALVTNAAPQCLTLYPGIAATANAEVNQVLGCHWRVVAVVAVNAVTFSIGAEYLI